jgi:hypothetical protein
MGDAFVLEQERRRRERLSLQIYDVTGWSLPALFDVEARETAVPGLGAAPRLAAGGGNPVLDLPEAGVAYLLPWGTGTAALAVEALEQGLLLRRAGRPLSLGGRAFPAGTLVIRVADNPSDLAARLGVLAQRHGATVVATDTGWVDGGISLGSDEVVALKRPRVLLGWDRPSRSLSAGWARYVLERRYGQPVTAVRIESLGEVPLHEYDVLVLPEGDYRRVLDEDGVARLRAWLRAGGTLVTLGEASRWAAFESVGLLATGTELRDGRREPEPGAEKEPAAETPAPVEPGEKQQFDYEQAIAPLDERPDPVPGALLRVRLDQEHWLASGSDGELQAVVEGRRVFAPIRLDEGRNVGVYSEADALVASGLVWDDARERLARKAFLIHQPVGEGHLVAFAEDPNYRAFAEATQLLFINAVLLAPAY